MTSIVTNEDCMELMRRYPDKHFALAVVDPPYGLGEKLTNGGGNHLKFKNHKEIQKWDIVPSEEYFKELFRVSRDQVIWGGNYFNLGPCRLFLIWDKMQSVPNFSACEFAWSSIDGVSKMFKYRQAGCFGETKIHPTQKPIALYQWIYNKLLPAGGKVLDTHLGSGSNRIAADKAGNIDFTACELDTEYFIAQEKRWKDYKSQLSLFA
ncbi:MAG TPA: hypothetical protein PJ995_21820 [Cyclobacteriaceae bacterium]|nr:hypothetical protein [Cyclobacteriaceae bacterium]